MQPEGKIIRLGHPSYVWRQGQERRMQWVRDHVPLAGACILDVGCGLGLYMRRLRDFGEQVYGVELDGERAREAARTLPDVAVAAAEHLPFAAGSFDVVFSHEVLEHVADDRAAIIEAHRVLREGGHLVLFVPNRYYPFETHGCYWRGRYHFGNIPLINYLPSRWRERLCPHVRAYTYRGLRRLFAGLPGEITVHRVLYAGYDGLATRHPRLASVLRRICYMLERTPLQFLGLSHFLVFRKRAASIPTNIIEVR